MNEYLHAEQAKREAKASRFGGVHGSIAGWSRPVRQVESHKSQDHDHTLMHASTWARPIREEANPESVFGCATGQEEAETEKARYVEAAARRRISWRRSRSASSRRSLQFLDWDDSQHSSKRGWLDRAGHERSRELREGAMHAMRWLVGATSEKVAMAGQ